MSVSVYSNTLESIARQNYTTNFSSFSQSLQQLSSGVRVSSTVNDAVTVSLSNGLDLQAVSLGQAARNATDAVSITQVADSSLTLALDVLADINTKAIEASSTKISDSGRLVLQGDVSKLLHEFDLLISSSSYNQHKLLTGSFLDKKFQVGSSSGEVLILSLPDSRSDMTGLVNLTQSTPTTVGGLIDLSIFNPYTTESLTIKDIELSYSNSAATGMAALENAINRWQETTGFSSRAIVESISNEPILGGVANSNFAINGIVLGSVNVEARDSSSTLVNAINGKSESHGIVASIIDSGALRLLSSDGRGIEVKGLEPVMSASDASMSTFGYLKIYQPGSYDLSSDSGNVIFSTLLLDQSKSITMTLADISLTSRVNALDAIAVTDAALADIQKIQANNLASQDQFKAAANVLEVTKMNVSNAGKTMQSVDFDEQTSNVAKMQMLMQAGAFAMVQANTWHGFPLDFVRNSSDNAFNQFFTSVIGKIGSISGDAFFKEITASSITPVVKDS